MKRLTKYLLLAAMIALRANANAQVLSLDSVLAMVERQSPMLREYEFRAAAYGAYAKGASAWMAPMVGAGSFMTPYRPSEALHENEKGSWMFSVEQEIPNPSKQKANRAYLESRAGIERESRSEKLNELRTRAKAVYLEWVVAEKRLSILNESAKAADLMVRLARIRYPYNQGTLGNIYQAEGKAAEIENLTLSTQSDIERYRFELLTLMNLPPTDPIAIDTTTLLTFSPVQIANDTVGLGQQRSDIRRINESIQVMSLNQELQKAGTRPDFKLRFDHMQPIGDMPRQFTAMAMVSIPIAPWSSRMYKAGIKGMEYEIEGMRRSREAILVEARGMLAGTANRIARLKQQLDNYEAKIIPALRRNHETLMLAYEENREQLPPVIDAWDALYMAQLEYLEKLRDYYLMIVQYEKEIEK